MGGICDAVPRFHVNVYTRLFEMNLKKTVDRNTGGESLVAVFGQTWTPGCYSAEHLLFEIVSLVYLSFKLDWYMVYFLYLTFMLSY